MEDLGPLHGTLRRHLEQTRLGPRRLGDYPGDFVKNGPESFRRDAIYFCGLNPGGAPAGKTLLEQLPDLGRSPSQWLECEQNMRFGRQLATLFGQGFSGFFFTNLIFLPSSRQEELQRAHGIGWDAAIDACWPIHEAFLDRIRPTLIIACGRLAFEGIARKLGAAEPVEIRRIPGQRPFLRKTRIANGAVLLGIPHLSRCRCDAPFQAMLAAEGVPVGPAT